MPCTPGDTACDIRLKEGQAASLESTALPQSHDLGAFQGHRMQGRVEKGCFGRARSELREEELFGRCREHGANLWGLL